jgi:hypothetical protein
LPLFHHATENFHKDGKQHKYGSTFGNNRKKKLSIN